MVLAVFLQLAALYGVVAVVFLMVGYKWSLLALCAATFLVGYVLELGGRPPRPPVEGG